MDSISPGMSTLMGMALILVIALIVIMIVLWSDNGSGGGNGPIGPTGHTGHTGCGHPNGCCDDFSGSYDHSKYIIEELSRIKQEYSEMSQLCEELRAEIKRLPKCDQVKEAGTVQSVEPSSQGVIFFEETLQPQSSSDSDKNIPEPPSPPRRRGPPIPRSPAKLQGEETFSLSSDFSSSRSKEHDK